MRVIHYRSAVLIVSTVLALALPASAQPIDYLARVRALALDSLPGVVPTYYSPGFRVRSDSLQEMLEEASGFFAERLEVTLPFRLAVLDEEHWARVRPVPYAVPWVSREPFLVVLPARPQRSIVVQNYLTAAPRATNDVRRAIEAEGLTLQTAAYHMNDFVGYHEVGHVLVRVYGLEPTQSWFDEFLATYAAYSFLRERHPRLARIWDAMLRLNRESRRPAFRTLEEFDRHEYTPPETNSWYHGMFQARVTAVYDTLGIEFLSRVRRAGLTTGVQHRSTAELLRRLEEIAPGFQAWAHCVGGSDRRGEARCASG